MARAVTAKRKLTFTVIGWLIGLTLFFPILWTILTSFKTEGEAVATPPSFLFFNWTLENYFEVQSRSDYFRHAINSVVISFGSTLLGLIVAIPAAWSMAFSPSKRTKDILMRDQSRTISRWRRWVRCSFSMICVNCRVLSARSKHTKTYHEPKSGRRRRCGYGERAGGCANARGRVARPGRAPDRHDEGLLCPDVGPIVVVRLANDIDVNSRLRSLLFKQQRGINGALEGGICGGEIEFQRR